jgi:hypothetical protein
MALISVMITILFIVGFAVIEESNVTFLLLLGIPFTAVAVWSFWRALREDNRLPTDKEVRVGMTASRSINRHALSAFTIIGVQLALTAMQSATDGVLQWILIVVDVALLPVWLWLFWRFLREARKLGANSASG